MTIDLTKPVRVPRTNIVWTGLDGWIEATLRVGSILRAAEPHYKRCERLYRSLTIEHIRAGQDAETLASIIQLFSEGKHGRAPYGVRFDRVLTRAEIGERVMEARNQHRRVLAGIGHRERIKGPRFDPRRLPPDRLAHLIQSHPDLAIVEALRAERERRATWAR